MSTFHSSSLKRARTLSRGTFWALRRSTKYQRHSFRARAVGPDLTSIGYDVENLKRRANSSVRASMTTVSKWYERV